MTLLLPHDLSQQFALSYGNGLTPLQWVTSLFVHGGIIHLLGNMFFLWGFGLIVEGKLGWSRFIPLYLVIGAAESAIEQFAFSQQEGMSFGASSAIFGLMAVSLIWAPRNELSVFYWLGLKAGVADVSV
ncbi:MAG: rhomboid family intramembrane serine protease, partial [Planctomycetaceae bacterium]|nr:rhomboid family intramembrane serine protease [Planctomycetaceae bacterium]